MSREDGAGNGGVTVTNPSPKNWRDVDPRLTEWVGVVRRIAAEKDQYAGLTYRELATRIEELLKRADRLEAENDILKRGGV